MDWLNLMAFIIAALSFLGLCWQVVRAESLAPSPSLNIEWEEPLLNVEWNMYRVEASIMPAFGTVFYGLKIIEGSGSRLHPGENWKTDDVWKVTEDAPLRKVIYYPVDGSSCFIIQVLSVSSVRRRLIARAWRVTVSDGGVDNTGPKPRRVLKETRDWWVWYPGAEFLGWWNQRFAGWKWGLRFPLGYWRKGKGSYRAVIPVEAVEGE